jgi:hypothetical protein
MIRNLSFGMVVLGLGLLALPGCPSFFLVCEEGPCGTDGGLDGTLPDGDVRDTNLPDVKPDADPIPTDCTTPTDPTKNAEKCLVDSFGVFVSPTGDDTKDGSKANPFKTIGKALGTSRSRIVVCEGEYTGSLDVARAVEIYGGVACDFAKAGAKAKVVATKAAYGIKVSKVTAAVVLADLDVVGMNAAAPSESSIGIFASESADVKLLRARVEAGDGADAPAKKDGAFTMAAQAPKGGDAAGNTGGAVATSGLCPGGGTSLGGKGGDIGFPGDDAIPRPPGGAKVPIDCSNSLANGTLGTPGTDRAGATILATIAPIGLTGSKGQDGAPGTIGGGGGGGYGTMGAGGAGGAGGCGGQGGFGGAAGGSSVAVLVFASELTIETTELVAKNAKPGGGGGSGQPGQMGGARGTGSNMACNGGNGAAGGPGGNAGGGAGGIAAGIVWSIGKEPKRDAATKITRPTAAAPTGGEGGGGAATKGIDGVHADTFEVK